MKSSPSSLTSSAGIAGPHPTLLGTLFCVFVDLLFLQPTFISLFPPAGWEAALYFTVILGEERSHGRSGKDESTDAFSV